jgi:hypothetical protein
VQCKDRVYTFDRDPEFWKFLGIHFEKGLIHSSNAVYRELVAGKDELAKWARTRKETTLNTPENKDVQEAYNKITDFLESQRKYEVQHRTEFYRRADGWLVAQAMVDPGGIVVTHETPRETGKIKVQSVCVKVNVPYIDVYKLKEIFDYRARDYMEFN